MNCNSDVNSTPKVCKETIGETPTKREWDKNNPFKKLLSNVRYRSKQKGLEFDLDLEYLKSLDRDTCPYLNCPIEFNLPIVKRGQAHPRAKSLDRINSAKGYVKGNVIICSWKANRLLSDARAEELLLLASNFFRVLDSTKPTNEEN